MSPDWRRSLRPRFLTKAKVWAPKTPVDNPVDNQKPPKPQWSSGKLLVWDATCPDTFAQSHRSLAVLVAGKVAAKAEEHKERKYSDLISSHFFRLYCH